MMSPESKELFNKMNRLIVDANTLEDSSIVARYITLANRRLVKINDGGWGILGGCMAIKERYETKFGRFTSRIEGIQL